MATNDNPSIKSLNELLWMFMRQAAVEAQWRRAAAKAAHAARDAAPRPAKRPRGSKE